MIKKLGMYSKSVISNDGRRVLLGVISTFFLLFNFTFSTGAFALENADESTPAVKLEKVVTKKVRGIVSSVGYEKIVIETNREGGAVDEMLIPVSDSANFRGYKKLKDFQRGDTVDVTYEQIFTEREGGETTILKTSATEILLVKNAGSADKMTSREETVKE